MAQSQSARENGWVSYPADRWNENKPAPVGPHRFWTHCVEKYGGPILEVACGNGRWLIPLAEHGPGYEVVGVDINPGFIDSARHFARQRADAGHPADATFQVGDIVRLDLGRTFPLAIMTSWTFQVLLTQEDQIAFLQRLREHLHPGGAFAFNLFIPFHRQRGLTAKDGVYQWPPNPDYHKDAAGLRPDVADRDHGRSQRASHQAPPHEPVGARAAVPPDGLQARRDLRRRRGHAALYRGGRQRVYCHRRARVSPSGRWAQA